MNSEELSEDMDRTMDEAYVTPSHTRAHAVHCMRNAFFVSVMRVATGRARKMRAMRNIRLLYSYCMNFCDYKTLALI